MKIYTKTGDSGKTSLWGGVRVPKDDLRIRTYGTLDELNAVLGCVLAEGAKGDGVDSSSRDRLLRIQGELFQLGAELATPADRADRADKGGRSPKVEGLGATEVTCLEQEIDEMETQLKPLKNFILPGGTKAAAHLHLARTVCRRAERELISLHHVEPVREEVLQYLNRLSDYFFVMARFVGRGGTEIPWVGR